MAEEQVGLSHEQVREPAPWTKIFSGFRVAADPKKLLLAAAGIFVMALGWWLLASFFYEFNRKQPKWADYRDQVGESKRYKDGDIAFKSFKQDLNNWNLMHKLAGPSLPVTYLTAEGKDKAVDFRYTVADFSSDLKQFDEAQKELQTIRDEIDRKARVLVVNVDEANPEDTVYFALDDIKVYFKPGVTTKALKESLNNKVTAQELLDAYAKSPNSDRIVVRENKLDFVKKGADRQAEWQKFQNYVNSPKTLAQIEDEIIENKRANVEATRIALKVMRLERDQVFKPSGELATLPWFEYRGPNPYLALTDPSVVASAKTSAPVSRAEVILHWLVDQVPVLLEPLIKFLSPVVYFMNPSASFWTRIYLLLVILWTIATWSLFGGAITRMAAVQVARPTERVGMVEAVRFAVSRYRAFVASQLLPFAFLTGLALLLLVYGFFEIVLPIIGDILIAGLGFPLVLLLGLVMAVVLIGLTGWPLMYATISAEGSDSFDAISRSYSYVYQAPWQYLWYGFLALVYGAALVFFVGLMGSLLVYLGKFGMSLPAGIWPSRDPTYLFEFAPTSYGWRDLLLYQSQISTTGEVILNTGRVMPAQIIKPDAGLATHNTIGAVMVAFWLYLVFLMIIGFGYSYFWTASTIIYLLMRRKVDDTEMDEVHLEEEEIETPSYAPASAPAAAAPAPGGRATVPLNVVEGPPPPPPPPAPPPPAPPPSPIVARPAMPAPSADSEPPSHDSGTPAYPADVNAPPPSPKRTQLAPGSGLEDEHRNDDNGHGASHPE